MVQLARLILVYFNFYLSNSYFSVTFLLTKMLQLSIGGRPLRGWLILFKSFNVWRKIMISECGQSNNRILQSLSYLFSLVMHLICTITAWFFHHVALFFSAGLLFFPRFALLSLLALSSLSRLPWQRDVRASKATRPWRLSTVLFPYSILYTYSTNTT